MDNINDSTAILVKNITDNFLATLNNSVQQLVVAGVSDKLRQIDVGDTVRSQVNTILNSNNRTFQFPERSVPGSSINPAGLYLKPEQIVAGTYRNFESTGVSDQAASIQLVVTDDAVTVSNHLTATALTITGDVAIQGNLSVAGTIPQDSQLFQDLLQHTVGAVTGQMAGGVLDTFQNRIFDTIARNGIDVNNVLIQGTRLVNNNTLAPTVLASKLQSVGALKELQVIGETLLASTLYSSGGRVGINTTEPETVLDIWDQEVEVTIGKFSQNVAMISAPKNQRLVIGSNQNTNLVVNPDGGVVIENLTIGKVNFTSADTMPTTNSPIGSIVWNNQPAIGAPVGWVSLGGARWANFGTVYG